MAGGWLKAAKMHDQLIANVDRFGYAKVEAPDALPLKAWTSDRWAHKIKVATPITKAAEKPMDLNAGMDKLKAKWN